MINSPTDPIPDHWYTFTRAGVRRSFKFVGGGWNDGVRFRDAVTMEEEGWRFVGEAG